MKLHLIFIGNKFIYNTPLREYVIRKIEQKTDFIDSITFFKESDNSLFLYLEEELNSLNQLIVVTTKQHFSTIGKVICTATGDNQILKENMLIPSKCSVFEDRSYLLEHNSSQINVLHVDEMQKLPEILLYFHDSKATLHLFEEDKESAVALLSPIAQTYDVNIDIVNIIDGWLRIDVRSKKYGDISKFINSAKQLLPKKLIPASCVVGYIIDKLSANKKKLSFAESCTGGLLAYYFTKNNGASKMFDGSLITYSNTLKENWLGVENAILEKSGAVSKEVVSEMSDGAMNVSSSDYSISISGIAGEGGGTEHKPVGTIYIGVRSKKQHAEEHLNLSGDRNYIQHQSVLFGIKMLLLVDKDMFF
ncbi:CinA family protein [Candidatus Sulfurimonas baltica]|uniref:CinA family protein n=1 Tax=Candidatus Sulfurimonas baltica TaxID=2740404 RepID=A0A7S7LTM1_9BACT|nr:CinA family protein [Candidatus Sulfurimonas baltica]QOY51158.1 CinA family protein [Candidatus Sulfurimonas baltica]